MNALAVAVSRERVRPPISDDRVADAVRVTLRAEKVRHALISVTFVTGSKIAALNVKHLGHRGPTDVISFGFARGRGHPVVADIYIAPAVARVNARRHGAGIREELVRLVVHGVLHALGYDHPNGDARLGSPMWRRQETLVRRVMRTAA
ncbi:MAG TPA: rRNA maturation RNase YbeY [Gemmatimonadaceae bacterium]|jgi:probable rRNA maturation factor